MQGREKVVEAALAWHPPSELEFHLKGDFSINN
jgi:hypothetical protein